MHVAGPNPDLKPPRHPPSTSSDEAAAALHRKRQRTRGHRGGKHRAAAYARAAPRDSQTRNLSHLTSSNGAGGEAEAHTADAREVLHGKPPPDDMTAASRGPDRPQPAAATTERLISSAHKVDTASVSDFIWWLEHNRADLQALGHNAPVTAAALRLLHKGARASEKPPTSAHLAAPH